MERRGRSESCEGSKMNRAWRAAREAGMEADSGAGAWGRERIVPRLRLGSGEKKAVWGRGWQFG